MSLATQVTKRATRRSSRRKPARSTNYRFSPRDTTRRGCFGQMASPLSLHCLGSTACAVGAAVVNQVEREFGRIPIAMSYLLIDSDAPASHFDLNHFVPLGRDGAGTVPQLGRKLYEKNRARIRHSVSTCWESMLKGDTDTRVNKSALRSTTVHIIAGAGGTSGGCLDPHVDTVLEVASQHGVRECRVEITLIGPEISIRDVTRVLTNVQELTIRDTFAQNFGRILRGFARRDGRVFALQLVDQSNDDYVMTRNSELIEMLGLAVFLQRFTKAGMRLDGRRRDHIGLDEHDGPPR